MAAGSLKTQKSAVGFVEEIDIKEIDFGQVSLAKVTYSFLESLVWPRLKILCLSCRFLHYSQIGFFRDAQLA